MSVLTENRPLPKRTGRKCATCHGDDTERINALIAKSLSFRDISRQVCGNDTRRQSIQRHAEQCLGIETAAVMAEQRREGAITTLEAVEEQFEVAKNLRDRAKEYAEQMPEGEVTAAFKTAMDGVKTVDKVLDTRAKLHGEYQDNRPNESQIAKIADAIRIGVETFRFSQKRDPSEEELMKFVRDVLTKFPGVREVEVVKALKG